jgi:hypothetical protein
MLHELQILSLEIAATSLFSMEASTFGSELREMVSNYMDTVGRLYPTDVLLPDGVPTLLRARRALFRRRWMRLIRSIIEVRGDALHVGAPRDLFDLAAAQNPSLVVNPGSLQSVTVPQGYENRPADLLAVWRRPACMYRCPIGDVGGDTGHGTTVADIHYCYDERSTGATGRHAVNATRPCTHICTASS